MDEEKLRVILVRPGSTEFDEQGRIVGNLDVPLSDEGNIEVAETVGQLRDQEIEAVYSSPSESAATTGEALAAALDRKCKTLDKLRNVDHGLWQGMLIDEVKRKQPKVYRQWQQHPETVCPPEGEMLADAHRRVESVVSKLRKKHRQGMIALVAPEPLASLLRCTLNGSDLDSLPAQNGDAKRWEIVECLPQESVESK